MRNTNFLRMVHSLIGKTLAIALFFAVMAVAANAQCGRPVPGTMQGWSTGGWGTSATPTAGPSNNLYYERGGAYYGRVTVFPGSHFEIDPADGTVIKTFANSCRQVSVSGVAGVRCTFAQFRNGQHIYSGWGYFFQNGLVYLDWTNENMGGWWQQIDSGWYGFRP